MKAKCSLYCMHHLLNYYYSTVKKKAKKGLKANVRNIKTIYRKNTLILRLDTRKGMTQETQIHKSARTVQLLSYRRLSLS